MATPMGAGTVPEWTQADRLRKARETAGLKQTDLAELTGISRASIVNYEAGKGIPRRPMLASWAWACSVSFDWLATGDNPHDTGPTGHDGTRDMPDRRSGWIATQDRPDAMVLGFPARKAS